jgi:hypothetical protein
MTYRIRGLERSHFEHYFSMTETQLVQNRARRITASAERGYPCRISLKDARQGEDLVLVHHTSHDVETPYRSAYAIYVRESAIEPAEYVDTIPPVFERRPLALRGFDKDGLLTDARLVLSGEADVAIREFLENRRIAYIHAHNAAHGCFAARIDRA